MAEDGVAAIDWSCRVKSWRFLPYPPPDDGSGIAVF